MLVSDVVDLAKARLGNIALSKDKDTLIKFIYLGVSELYRIFNLSIQTEAVEINPNSAMYELRNKDVSLLLSLYDLDGRELKQSDVIDGNDWEVKMINYRTFIVNNPINSMIYAVYKASPNYIKDIDDEIDIPDAMIDALLCYVSYMVNSTINSGSSSVARSGNSNADLFYNRFKQLCGELENQGYKLPLTSESLSILVRGYK